ncbi:BrnT family toxin [Microbulbifer sp.]|uniref:BrnT family toxin n=1 Tax=Microbulbifer sp. TaxID=1908541 RepID=UPI003F32793D
MYKCQYGAAMRFEWDPEKNVANIRKHGIDFADAKDIFNHPMLALPDDREDYGEERWVALGWIRALIGVVVYTERRGDVIRIISARKATKSEVCRYEQNCKV